MKVNNWQASGKPQQKAPAKHRLRQAKVKQFKQLVGVLKVGING